MNTNTCDTSNGTCATRDTHALPLVRPLTNLIETDTGFRVELLLPGVAEKDVDVQLEDDVLTVRAGATFDVPAEDTWRLVRSEFELARYEHRFRLGRGLDPASIRASLKNGLLRLEVKRVAPVAQRIAVQST